MAALNAGGHPLRLSDLARYEPQWKRPLCTAYRGLTVLSLSSLNPGAVMNRLMGSSGSGQERMEFGSEPTDVKLRLADALSAFDRHAATKRPREGN